MIIAIEGIDGAGKNTLVTRLKQELNAAGRNVDVIAFPRYADSIHAQLAQKALYGQMGDLTDSIHGMATLFALDRFGAKEEIAAKAERGVLILDRYVASNAAYSWARLQDEAAAQWVYDLEFGTLGLPRPDVQVFLDTDVELAAQRAQQRSLADASRAKDEYEKDGGLQARVAEAYRALAAQEWGGRWIATPDTDKIVTTIAQLL